MANMALELVGANTITSFDVVSAGESAKNVRLCKRFFDPVYDQVLRKHPWRSALVLKELAQTTAPLFKYNYSYALPTDPWCLKFLQLEEPDYEFRLVGRHIYTDEGAAKILYIGRVEPGNLDPWLVKVIYYTLAVEMCFAITASVGLAESLNERLNKEILVEARHYNSTEGLEPDWLKQKDSWVDSRFVNNIGPYT